MWSIVLVRRGGRQSEETRVERLDMIMSNITQKGDAVKRITLECTWYAWETIADKRMETQVTRKLNLVHSLDAMQCLQICIRKRVHTLDAQRLQDPFKHFWENTQNETTARTFFSQSVPSSFCFFVRRQAYGDTQKANNGTRTQFSFSTDVPLDRLIEETQIHAKEEEQIVVQRVCIDNEQDMTGRNVIDKTWHKSIRIYIRVRRRHERSYWPPWDWHTTRKASPSLNGPMTPSNRWPEGLTISMFAGGTERMKKRCKKRMS